MMSKAILEFTLPEEQSEYNAATDGIDNFNTLWDLDQKMRGFLKYQGKTMTSTETMEFVREYINDRVNFERVD